MGLMTATIFAMGAFQGVNQIATGMQQQKMISAEAEANAAIADINAARLAQQAGFVDQKKEIQAARDDRAIKMAMGATVAATASKGLRLSGSPIAIMMDTQIQLEMDKAIGQYNLDIEKTGILTESRLTSARAKSIRRMGSARAGAARTAGVAGGLSTLLKSASNTLISTSSFDTRKYVNVGGKRTLVAPNDYYLRASSA